MAKANRLLAIIPIALLALAGGTRLTAADEVPKADPGARAQKLAAKQKEVREALRGTWERVGSSDKPMAGVEYRLLTFDGDVLTVSVKGDAKAGAPSKHHYHLNPLRDPPEITLHNDHGLIQGVYKLDGDTLTLATCADPAAERPKGFTAATTGELLTPLTVATFKRAGAKPSAASDWEARAVKALVAADRDALPALAAEFRKLPAEARRALPVSVRDDAVEFTFRGHIPPGESVGNVELLVAGEDKGYEALLVSPKGELDRLPALRPFFAAHAQKDRRLWWHGRLIWVEDGGPRSVDLDDVFGLLPAKERAEFLDGQEIDVRGYLGGEDTTGKNVPCDPAALPRKLGPAVLQITLMRAPRK